MQQTSVLLILIITIIDVLGFKFVEDHRLKRQDFYSSNYCKTPENQKGRCININSCPPLLNLQNQSSYNYEARDYVSRSKCGLAGTVLRVCCTLYDYPVSDTAGQLNSPINRSKRFYSNNYKRFKRQDFDSEISCRTPSNKIGRCINIKACPPLVNLLQQVSYNSEARDFLLRARCGFEGRVPKVCCSDDVSETDERPSINGGISQPNIDGRPTPGTDGRPITPSDNNSGAGNEGAPRKFPQQCGKSEASIHRIVGGRPANLRAWPWVAALGYRSGNQRQPIAWNCGGALVTDRHVITAAHCIAGKKVLMVRLGDLDLNTTDDGANHIDVPVDRAIVHEDYNAATHTTDIGIVRLRNPVEFNDDIQPICLPFSRQLRTKSVIGFSPFIAGWGALAYKSTYPTKLYEAQVEIKSQDSCNAAYRKLPRNPVVIDDRVICAGGDKRDACQGDSGGPLMLPQQGLFYLYGVVSYGYKCAEIGFPGVYTRVTEFVDWIDENAN